MTTTQPPLSQEPEKAREETPINETLTLLKYLQLPAVVSLRVAAIHSGVAYQTLLNRLSAKTCALRVHKDGSRVLVHLVDLAAFIDGRRDQTPKANAPTASAKVSATAKRGPGRPAKADQIARRSATRGVE